MFSSFMWWRKKIKAFAKCFVNAYLCVTKHINGLDVFKYNLKMSRWYVL